MRRKQLESALGAVQGFQEAKVGLEQYATPVELAVEMGLWVAEEVEGALVADLGLGTGRLAIAAALVGAEHVVGFECDGPAASLAAENAEEAGVEERLHVVLTDVRHLPSLLRRPGPPSDAAESSQTTSASQDESSEGREAISSQAELPRRPAPEPFDVVLMNPPFGTKDTEGIDAAFVRVGLGLCSRSVLSLHKTATRTFLRKLAQKEGADFDVLAELRWPLPKTFRFHRQATKDIRVDFLRFDKLSVVKS